MPTRKPLSNMIPDILAHIEAHRDTSQFNLRLYKIDEGQLRAEIEASLAKEMVSQPALQRALQRIPSINILKKAVDKLSKVYAQTPVRTTEDKSDQDLMDTLAKRADLDNVMSCANRMYNLQRMCAIEFFVQDKTQRLRVLAGHQFLPYSDDIINPLNLTVFIKFMGSERKVTQIINNADGKRVAEDNIRNVDIFHLYSDSEFLVIDSEGSIRTDKMQEIGMSGGKNPYGIIPFVYINASRFELVPFPNKTGFDISILIPKLLTDLNYAAQFLSHSIIWTKNADLNGAEIAPDSIVNLGDSSSDGGEPEMGTINPTVDIESVLQLIEFQMSGYLSSIGIKSATQGSMLPGREASGFAKAMDEGDATQERNNQAEEFKRFEKNVWEKLTKIQDIWSGQGKVDEKRKFTPKFVANFSVQFGEMKHLTTQSEKIEKVRALRELGAISTRQIIKQMNPDFTPEQVTAWLDEAAEQPATVTPTVELGTPQFNGQTEVANSPDNQTQPNAKMGTAAPQATAVTAQQAQTGVINEVSLNGIQVKAMVEVVQAVAREQLPRASGVIIIKTAFGLDDATAESIMGEVGRGFTIEPEVKEVQALVKKDE